MNKDIRTVCDIKEKVFDLLDQANEQDQFSMGDVDWLYKATKVVKNACEIEDMMCMDDDGYSYDDGMSMRGRNGGMNRGGNRDNGGRRGGDRNQNRDSRGRYGRGYSQEGGRSEMIKYLKKALSVANEDDGELLQRLLTRMDKMPEEM